MGLQELTYQSIGPSIVNGGFLCLCSKTDDGLVVWVYVEGVRGCNCSGLCPEVGLVECVSTIKVSSFGPCGGS